MVLVAPFVRLLGHEAPLIDLMVKPVTGIDLVEQVDLGPTDVATGVFSSPPDHLRSGFLFEYDDVLTGSEKRKLGKLDMAKLADLAVVLVVLGREQDGAIDGFISERGLARRSDMYDRTALEQALAGSERLPRIAVHLPHFLAMPALLEDTERVGRQLTQVILEDHHA
jgi:hypothetical protein